MAKEHNYQINLKWTGNRGEGTKNYTAYSRSYEISLDGKETIYGSSDPNFRGDKTRYNPEELLVASLVSCHLLWYLHLCAEAKIVVTNYKDKASGKMTETSNGGGKFVEVTLNPHVTITKESDAVLAKELHKKANELCFIANSVNFPVLHKPEISFEI